MYLMHGENRIILCVVIRINTNHVHEYINDNNSKIKTNGGRVNNYEILLATKVRAFFEMHLIYFSCDLSVLDLAI